MLSSYIEGWLYLVECFLHLQVLCAPFDHYAVLAFRPLRSFEVALSLHLHELQAVEDLLLALLFALSLLTHT
jgi:hypothetical protein